MSIEEVREEIAKRFWHIQINNTGIMIAPADWDRVSDEGRDYLKTKADQILSIKVNSKTIRELIEEIEKC